MPAAWNGQCQQTVGKAEKGGVRSMLELGNEAQVRSALEGKSGFGKEIEDELIRRVAITELEQEQYEPLSGGHKIGLAISGILGIVLAIVAFF